MVVLEGDGVRPGVSTIVGDRDGEVKGGVDTDLLVGVASSRRIDVRGTVLARGSVVVEELLGQVSGDADALDFSVGDEGSSSDNITTVGGGLTEVRVGVSIGGLATASKAGTGEGEDGRDIKVGNVDRGDRVEGDRVSSDGEGEGVGGGGTRVDQLERIGAGLREASIGGRADDVKGIERGTIASLGGGDASSSGDVGLVSGPGWGSTEFEREIRLGVGTVLPLAREFGSIETTVEVSTNDADLDTTARGVGDGGRSH